MSAALVALCAETYFDKELQVSAKTLAMEAVADILSAIGKANINNTEAKNCIIAKLENIDYVIMAHDEILNRTKVAELYDELDLDGSESVLEMQLSMQQHFKKLHIEKTTNWKRKLSDIVLQPIIKYFTDENILC